MRSLARPAPGLCLGVRASPGFKGPRRCPSRPALRGGIWHSHAWREGAAEALPSVELALGFGSRDEGSRTPETCGGGWLNSATARCRPLLLSRVGTVACYPGVQMRAPPKNTMTTTHLQVHELHYFFFFEATALYGNAPRTLLARVGRTEARLRESANNGAKLLV